MLLTTSDRSRGEVVNVGNPEEVTILELAQRIKKSTGSTSPVTFHPLPQDDPRRRCPDISVAKGILGWKPEISLKEGLARTITWFQRRGA
jgi:nucleoside-diphosphate-sugar epimerase